MRFLAARRRLGDTSAKLPPMRSLATGDEGLGIELVRAMTVRLAPDEIIDVWGDETQRVAELVTEAPWVKRRRLVRWWDIHEAVPGPVVLGSLRQMKRLRGTHLVATTATEPHQAFYDAGVWDWEVDLRLSQQERLAWVQTMLGGAHRDVAAAVVARTGTSPAALRSACATLGLVVDGHPTVADVAELVPADAGRDYVDALVAGDIAGALRSAPAVVDAHRALARLQWRLMDLWTLSELRPPAGARPAREVAKVTELPRWVVDDLVPHARRFPRARVGECLDALAVAQLGLRRVPDRPASVLTVLAVMWAGGR